MHRCPSCHRRIAGTAPCPRDGWSPPRSAPAEIPGAAPHIEGFRLTEPLGRGGSAIVWAGWRERDHLPVALKVGLADSPENEARFRREAGALDRIGPPHVPQLHGWGRLDDNRPWIAMDRLFGWTLAAELAALPAQPDQRWAVRRAEALLAAVEAAHARGLIHRDLKPENIFLVQARGGRTQSGPASRASAIAEERAVLLDFGLATGDARAPAAPNLVDVRLTRAGSIMGTPEYMAPEQVRGDRALDARTDIYAFGVILFELLTLRLPFVGDANAVEHGHLALRPPRPSELAPVPEALEKIVLACLAKDPDRRPASAALLRRDLADACASGIDPVVDTGEDTGPVSAGSPQSARSARLIADGCQPAVVLVADVNAAAPAVIAVLTGRNGFVVRQRGRRYVAVFSGLDVDQPAEAARAAARELVERYHARAALHLSGVTIRRKARGAPVVYGAAVDSPETWMPSEPWSGIVPSEAIALALAEAELPPQSTTGSSLADADMPPIGRGEVLEALQASAAAAFDGVCPGLLTLIGEDGLGKTRLAAEAVAVARLHGPDALVVAVRTAQPLSGDAMRETAEILRVALDAPHLPPPDIRAFCEERLGEAIGGAAWPAVATALGWRAQAPGASPPYDLMRAIAEGLRRRARRGPVAVILDDAQWADDALLDALEVATLDGGGVALWVVVIAHPRFELLRPTWGTRTQRFDKVTLAPLDEPSGMQLAAALLLPAEYPPADMLRRLAAWAGGNPACLTEIVRSLKRAGILIRQPNTESFYVATAELESLPPSLAWQWLAMRQLEALPPELAACARLCAVLGVSFTRAELEWVEDAVDRAGGAGTPVDAGFGLKALAERRLLIRGAGERYRFQSGVFQDSVYEMLDPEHRKQIHRHALTFWRARVDAGGADPELLVPLARHAGACGACEEASAAWLRLGDIAFSAHRHVEADQHYTAALGLVAEDDLRRRALALAGRGRTRYRMHRTREATEDLRDARDLAEQLADEPLVAEILLEEATLLDWIGDYEESARRVELARPRVERSGSPRLGTRLVVALGRTCVRRAQVTEAIALLEKGAAEAESSGDHDSRVVALLLLSVELAHAGSFSEAEQRARAAIDLCAQVQDLPHLCIAYMNRVVLWTLKKSPFLATEDLRRAISLAREIGNPWLERVATYNVAELLYWSDQQDEALALARRARVLEQRFIERPVPECSLLLARILAAAGQYEEARRLIGWIAGACAPDSAAPAMAAHFQMLQTLLADEDEGAREPGEAGVPSGVDVDVEGLLFADELLEVLYWRARVAVRRGLAAAAAAIVRQAQAMVVELPAWRSRFDGIARDLQEVQAGVCGT